MEPNAAVVASGPVRTWAAHLLIKLVGACVLITRATTTSKDRMIDYNNSSSSSNNNNNNNNNNSTLNSKSRSLMMDRRMNGAEMGVNL